MTNLTHTAPPEMQLHVLVFKSNIRYKKDLKIIERHLNPNLSIVRWNVDMDDNEKILRIESTHNNPEDIIYIIRQAGFECEELTD
jgi:copper chaperone